VPEIVDAIRAQSVVVPGGKFGAEPAPPGTEFTYTVRLPDRLQNAEEFGEIVVRTADNGSQVKLKHIARVELGVETYNAFTRMNGKPCAMIALYQAPGPTPWPWPNRSKPPWPTCRGLFPKACAMTSPWTPPLAITAGIDEIIETLFIALALVILVVFIFIQDWRATLIPTIAIPVSLLATFMAFPMIGFTINVLSLLGLVLAIGIVVDDAIVVVEAVQVKIEEGMTPKAATKAAMKEVTAPVIATTLVMVAIFIPVAVMGGITGRLYQQFAITVAVSVVFSSINALTLSPALCGLCCASSSPCAVLWGPSSDCSTVFDKTTVSLHRLYPHRHPQNCHRASPLWHLS
jgi:HAE1 family hydrophobic/amphiphilic exporter-1